VLLVIYKTWDPKMLTRIQNPPKEIACWARESNPGPPRPVPHDQAGRGPRVRDNLCVCLWSQLLRCSSCSPYTRSCSPVSWLGPTLCPSHDAVLEKLHVGLENQTRAHGVCVYVCVFGCREIGY
jgi:hypothetical protein